MKILNRIGFRFALLGTVLCVISLFARDTHKLKEVGLFGSIAVIGWLVYFVTRNR